MSVTNEELQKIKIVNNRLDQVPEISLVGNIGTFDAEYISYQINNLPRPGTEIDPEPARLLRMNINSFGGSVMQAFSIVTAMQNFMNSGGEIETVNAGRADSAASWIFAMGTRGRRKIMQFAGIFVHPPVLEDGTEIKDLPEGDDRRKEMENVYEKLIGIVVATTGRNASSVRRLMDNNTDMDSARAIREGFADEDIKVNNAPRVRNNVNRSTLVDIYNSVEYEIIDDKKTHTKLSQNKFRMSVLAGLLNLNAEASEDAIRQEIEKVLNQNKSLQSDLTNAKSELEKVKGERDQLKEEVGKVKDAEIVNYVDQLIKQDAGKKDQRDNLINMAKTGGLEAFKTLVPLKSPGGEVKNGADISDGIEEDENGKSGDQLKVNAEKFKNMTLDERLALQKKNYAEFRNMSEAYDNYYSKPQK